MRSPAGEDIVDEKLDEFLVMLLADEQMKAGAIQISNRPEANLRQLFLAQPQPSSQRVITALHQGARRLSDAAAMASVSVEVARKVLTVMQKV